MTLQEQARRLAENLEGYANKCVHIGSPETVGDLLDAAVLLRTFAVAQASALDRYQVAKLVYATWLDADFITENHFAWFDAGKDNPESCVHYSNVAKALKVADRILGLTPSVPSTNRAGLLDPGIDGPYNEPCEHKSIHDGPRVEMRWGSAPTQVCDCGMWRINLHVPGLWREPPVTSTHRGTP